MKGPNSSQYDFKGTSVYQLLQSKNPLQAPISPLLPEQEALAVEPQAVLNQIKEEDSPTSSRIKQMNSKAPNTEPPLQQKTQTILKKISRNLKKRSTPSSKNVSTSNWQVFKY